MPERWSKGDRRADREQRERPCPTCHGRGEVKRHDDRETCPTCKGRGVIISH